MNNIIAVFDNSKLSERAHDYTAYLANHFNAHVVAAYVDEDETNTFPLQLMKIILLATHIVPTK